MVCTVYIRAREEKRERKEDGNVKEKGEGRGAGYKGSRGQKKNPASPEQGETYFRDLESVGECRGERQGL